MLRYMHMSRIREQCQSGVVVIKVVSNNIVIGGSSKRSIVHTQLCSTCKSCCCFTTSTRNDKNGYTVSLRDNTVTVLQNQKQWQQQLLLSRQGLRYYTNTACTNTDDTATMNEHSSIIIPYILADIGEGIKEVEIIEWYVSIGDTIQQFDKVCLVQSDKATVEITSRYDGIITSLLDQNVGDIIQVGQPLLFLQTQQQQQKQLQQQQLINNDHDIKKQHIPSDAATTTKTTATHVFEDNDNTTSNDGNDTTILNNRPTTIDSENSSKQYTFPTRVDIKFQSSPAVRKLARQYNISNELSSIHGSGPNGRILKSDLQDYLQQNNHIPNVVSTNDSNTNGTKDHHHHQDTTILSTSTSNDNTSSTGTTKSLATTTTDTNHDDDDEIITLKGYNRLMYRTMSQSVSIPAMGFSDEIIMNELLKLRKSINNNNNNNNSNNTKISILAIILKICSIALTDYPIINSTIHNDEKMELKIRQSHNIGIAMQTTRGLVVPVIHNCQLLSIHAIQQEINRYKECGQTFTFTEYDLYDPTFVISNIGSIGTGTYMTPILVSPTIIIGALGTIQSPIPRYSNPTKPTIDTIYPASILPISWSADHRYLDGSTIAQFALAIKQYIEQPYSILTKLK